MKMFVLGLLACASAQAALLGPISVGGVRPDLFLLLLFLLSPRVSPEVATLQGFVIGLCQDALSGGPLGLRAFTFAFFGFLTAWLSHDLATEKPVAQFWLLLAGTAGAGVLTFVLLTFFVDVLPLLPALWVIGPEAVYTAVFGFLLLRLPPVRATLARQT
ncbi:MAG: rod shape-determining protein MreD [candidate division NC10 bacterium RBG_16_65_8]|nr:MAG: rod shape-determining protein MreD [candidate division NC10 bacterium RBG_16_65_8]